MNDLRGAAVLEDRRLEQDADEICGTTQKLHGEIFAGDIELLLNQIDQGLRADDATNLEKLNIARRYGPLLLQLKDMVQHGQFKRVLKERFPSVSYAKCNRWMLIARHETQVAQALEKFPDVAWGPKKMVDYLTEEWHPQTECEAVDEDEAWGLAPEGGTLTDPDDDTDAEFEEQDEEPDERSDWEALASRAESEARLLGADSVATSITATLSVTTFSQRDHDDLQEHLARWQPKSALLFGRQGANILTWSLQPQEISEVLLTMAAFLKKSNPSQLKLSIEL